MGTRTRRWIAYVPLAVAVVEILLFVALGQWIGFGWTVLLYLATSALGVMIISREGSRSWAAMKEIATTGRMPAPAPGDPGSRMLGGLLLTVPGLLSDAAGLLLLLPPVQAAMARCRPRPSVNLGGPGGGPGGNLGGGVGRYGGFGRGADVVEGEVLDEPGGQPSNDSSSNGPSSSNRARDAGNPEADGPRGHQLEG